MAAIAWTPELEQSVLESIESGKTIRQAAESNGISAALILKKVSLDAIFREQYTRVIELRTDSDFEQLMDQLLEEPRKTDFGTVDSGWVNWKRLQIDTIKWALSKRNPKKYGEKQSLEVSGTIDLAARMAEARERTERVIEAKIEPDVLLDVPKPE